MMGWKERVAKKNCDGGGVNHGKVRAMVVKRSWYCSAVFGRESDTIEFFKAKRDGNSPVFDGALAEEEA